MQRTIGRRVTAETVGTCLLLAAVVGSGIMGEKLAQGNDAIALLANSLATGFALAALIIAFEPRSGAHFNPVVTLALALMTFFFTHVEGIRANGVVGYFKSWIPPDLPKPMYFLIVPLKVLGQFMRLVSLSVLLYANMLAGHMLILTFIGLIFVLENVALALFSIPLATAFYLFEVVIVVSIQAFIFAALSAIYIGSAIEPEH